MEFLQRTSKNVSEGAGDGADERYFVVEPLPPVPEPGVEPDPLVLPDPLLPDPLLPDPLLPDPLLPDPLLPDPLAPVAPPPVVPDGVAVPGPELVPEPGAPMAEAAGLGGVAVPDPEVPEGLPEAPIPVLLVLLPGLVAVPPLDPYEPEPYEPEP